MTLKDYFSKYGPDQVASFTEARHDLFPYQKKESSRKEAIQAIIDDFNSLNCYENTDWKIMISQCEDYFSDADESGAKPTYFKASLINPEFTENPPQDLTPWGGSESDKSDCPAGYYNANYIGYHKYLGISGDIKNRRDIYHAQIEVCVELSEFFQNHGWHGIVAIIIWYLTFYGWTAGQSEEFFANLDKSNKF
jgi:hypothetical protein